MSEKFIFGKYFAERYFIGKKLLLGIL